MQPTTMTFGTIELIRRDDGRIGIGQADQCIAISIALFAQLAAADDSPLRIADGMICFRGLGPDGQPREIRYRAVALLPAQGGVADLGGGELLASLRANDGGWIVCERIA